MNAEQARAITQQALDQIKITYFDCLISIKQAAKNGERQVTIKGEINEEVKKRLVEDGFNTALDVRGDLRTTIIIW